MTNITVAICTWNRADLLDQTLERMHDLRIPEGVKWELLVVNNNCTDHTDEILARHAGTLPIRRLHEPKQGLSHSRNSAVTEARGECILWTDDDVLVDPEWLAEYVEASRRWPDASFFGGRIEPWFEREPPAWLRRNWPRVAAAYAMRDLGDESVRLSADLVPFGANFAVRTDVQRRYLYDPDLGRVGRGMIGGEETTVIRAMMADGYEGRWVSNARVRHYIPVDRLTRQFLARFFRGQGETAVLLDQGRQCPEPDGAVRPGRWAPRWAYRAYAMSRLRSLIFAPSSSPRWIDSFLRAAYLEGVIHAHWRTPARRAGR